MQEPFPDKNAGCRPGATYPRTAGTWHRTTGEAIQGFPASPLDFLLEFAPSKNGLLAQLVEQWTLNPTVASSNLARPTRNAKGMASAVPLLFGVSASKTGQILRQRLDLFIGQARDRGTHDVADADALAKILELLDDIRILLPRNAREFVQTLEIRLMAGDALGLGCDFLSLLDDCGIGLRGAANQGLPGEIFRQVLHVLVRQYDDGR